MVVPRTTVHALIVRESFAMSGLTQQTRRRRTCGRRRIGAVLSMELILVLPIALAMIFAMIEVGMLWAAGQRVNEAAAAGCRTASFRGADVSAVRRSIELNLGRKSLVDNYLCDVKPATPEAPEVCVTVSVPMKSAAPDLLKFIGFGLGDRRIVAQTIMRKE